MVAVRPLRTAPEWELLQPRGVFLGLEEELNFSRYHIAFPGRKREGREKKLILSQTTNKYLFPEHGSVCNSQVHTLSQLFAECTQILFISHTPSHSQ